MTSIGDSRPIGVSEMKELQEAMGFQTQAAFAHALGITQAHISQLYAGKRELKPGPLLHLIRCLRRAHGLA